MCLFTHTGLICIKNCRETEYHLGSSACAEVASLSFSFSSCPMSALAVLTAFSVTPDLLVSLHVLNLESENLTVDKIKILIVHHHGSCVLCNEQQVVQWLAHAEVFLRKVCMFFSVLK